MQCQKCRYNWNIRNLLYGILYQTRKCKHVLMKNVSQNPHFFCTGSQSNPSYLYTLNFVPITTKKKSFLILTEYCDRIF